MHCSTLHPCLSQAIFLTLVLTDCLSGLLLKPSFISGRNWEDTEEQKLKVEHACQQMYFCLPDLFCYSTKFSKTIGNTKEMLGSPALYHSNHMLFTICSAFYIQQNGWLLKQQSMTSWCIRDFHQTNEPYQVGMIFLLPPSVTISSFENNQKNILRRSISHAVDAPICYNLCPLWARLKMLILLLLQGPELNSCFGCSFFCLPSHLVQSQQMMKVTRTPHISQSPIPAFFRWGTLPHPPESSTHAIKRKQPLLKTTQCLLC